MLKIKDILKPCELIDSGYAAKQVVLKLLSYRQAKKCGRSSDHFMTKCIIHHGQGEVEQGFNVNKKHLVDNLQEDCLITLCFINDFMESSGGSPPTIKIRNKLIV